MIIDILLIIAISAFIITFAISYVREVKNRKAANKDKDKSDKKE